VVLAVGFWCAPAQADALAQGAGLQLMADRAGGNCVACHALPGQTGPVSNFGPALAGVASRYSADVLRQWVTDARQIKPDTLMPPFGTLDGTREPNPARPVLTAAQIDQVVLALAGMR
jgi:sulfur-oxidizing protein SoxX